MSRQDRRARRPEAPSPGSPGPRRSSTPEPALSPNARVMRVQRRGSGSTGSVAKLKLCVCGASSQLGRERSRLLRAEQLVAQRQARLAEREEAFNAFDEKVRRREEDLRERQLQRSGEDIEIVRRLDTLAQAMCRVEERHEEVQQRERALQQRFKDFARRQQRAQKRLERAEAAWQQLAEDRGEVAVLRARTRDEEAALETFAHTPLPTRSKPRSSAGGLRPWTPTCRSSA